MCTQSKYGIISKLKGNLQHNFKISFNWRFPFTLSSTQIILTTKTCTPQIAFFWTLCWFSVSPLHIWKSLALCERIWPLNNTVKGGNGNRSRWENKKVMSQRFFCEGQQAIFRKLRRFSNWAPNSSEFFRNDPPSILHFVKVTPTRFRLLWKLRILSLKIVPKFTTYFTFSHVYEINVHNLPLRHSISIHAYYCFVLLSWNLLIKMIPI